MTSYCALADKRVFKGTGSFGSHQGGEATFRSLWGQLDQ